MFKTDTHTIHNEEFSWKKYKNFTLFYNMSDLHKNKSEKNDNGLIKYGAVLFWHRDLH